MAHILLIEGEAQLRKLYRKFILAAGHRVTEAHDGVAGLAAFRADLPDLVIADAVMTEADDIELIRQMCQEIPGVKIIVIFSTASVPAASSGQVGAGSGAARALAKPFAPDKLLGVVDDLLGQS